MPESTHAETLRELLFSKVEGLIHLDDGPLKPGHYYHVPNEQVTYTTDETGMSWMGEGHIGLAHLEFANVSPAA